MEEEKRTRTELGIHFLFVEKAQHTWGFGAHVREEPLSPLRSLTLGQSFSAYLQGSFERAWQWVNLGDIGLNNATQATLLQDF